MCLLRQKSAQLLHHTYSVAQAILHQHRDNEADIITELEWAEEMCQGTKSQERERP